MPTTYQNYIILNTEEVHKALPLIIEKSIPIRRKKNDGSFSFVPPNDFDHFLKHKEVLFYIERETYDRDIAFKTEEMPFEELVNAKNKASSPFVEEQQQSTSFIEDTVFTGKIHTARQMNLGERIAILQGGNSQLAALILDGKKLNAETMKATEKIFSDALCINKVTLEDNIAGNVTHQFIEKLVNETRTMIESVITMMAKGKSSYADLANLDSIDSGSNTLDHMNRIMIRFISFMFFYNGYFQKFPNEIKKFRAYFKNKFYPYYDKLTQGAQNLSLEIVFKSGMTPIQDRSMFIDAAVGGFLHDVGKMPSIDYHDGNEGFDVMKARRHVFDSYNLLLHSKTFSWGVIAQGLLHHDYYSAPFGYNQTDTFKSKFPERRNRPREIGFTRYMMSYNVLDIAYDNAYSYFPNKMIELIDIFDSMTDTRKSSRKIIFSPEEALVEIKRCYLDGNSIGVDPILFDIFIDFLKASNVVTDAALVDNLKI